MLLLGGELPDDALGAEHCCCLDTFHRERLLEIELTRWSHTDVLDWLTHWGLSADHPPAQTRLPARTIMDNTHGNPTQIERELLQRCATA
ncbi:hypothetical protein [uncultured Thiodictyon sp.]|uniref:hypothetical protein n=1 Tax=uncultured Thiodictyon sp. TaxID=1846217 RepID=UPI0025E47D2F|nr:hypothetical protein [uncultured Thiodictyon sp.]